MSTGLAECWENTRKAFEKRFPNVRLSDFEWARMREMFYAGADAYSYCRNNGKMMAELNQEIGHFKGANFNKKG